MVVGRQSLSNFASKSSDTYIVPKLLDYFSYSLLLKEASLPMI